jgi:hypothetical protein
MVRVTRYSAKWSGLPGTTVIENLTTQAQTLTFPIPPPSIPNKHTHKRRALIAMYSFWEKMDKRRDFASRIPPPSTARLEPTPFHLGILRKYRKHGRRLYSTGTQIISGHGFLGTYSISHRTHAADNVFCPCHALPPRIFSRDHVLLQCPLHTEPRHRLFGRHLTLDYILGTEDGGHAFAEFVDETGVFLRPLPPRPDPP